MARVQPVLSETEAAIVSQLASLTRTKRTEVIKNALAVYRWFVRQAVTGARIVARKQTGEEVTLETAELAALEGQPPLEPAGAAHRGQETGQGERPVRGSRAA